MHDETVLMVASADGAARARLLWSATEIISVRDSTLSRYFQRDADWHYDPASQTLTLLPGNGAPFLSSEQLMADGQPRFEENHFFHTQQLNVTYRHAKDMWRGPTPAAADQLSAFHAKLRVHERVKLVVFGDSIAAGYNASGFDVFGSAPVAPYLKPWPELVACEIRAAHGVEVELINPSVPGKTSAWGRQNVHDLVSAQMPDLAIIAFGMNDRSAGVSDAEYIANITGIVDDIRAENPNAELVLVSPMLANPDWAGAGNPGAYVEALAHAADRPGVALVDMTSTHAALLQTKR